MGMMINRRRVCGGKRLPYDAEIEYLESTGTQWIDTGYKVNTSFHFDFDASISSFIRGSSIVGSTNNNTHSMYVFMDTGYILRYRIGNGSITVGNFTFDTYTRYNYNNIEKYQKLVVNTDYTAESSGSPNVNPALTYNFYMFCRNDRNTATEFSSTRIYFCKLYQDTALVRDYIPVRVGQVGYMYDKVSGQLFGNAGTGSFILGPDI